MLNNLEEIGSGVGFGLQPTVVSCIPGSKISGGPWQLY